MKLLIAGLMFVHSWYPTECCHDQDCHPVPCQELSQAGNGGWTWKDFYFGAERVKKSEDELCHACIHHEGTNSAEGLCLFIQREPST